MWVMEHGIANIISMDLIEKEGYKILYDTGGMWIVTTPAGENINFKRVTGVYFVMPYIYISKNAQAVNMLHTFRMNYEGYTKEEVEAVILA